MEDGRGKKSKKQKRRAGSSAINSCSVIILKLACLTREAAVYQLNIQYTCRKLLSIQKLSGNNFPPTELPHPRKLFNNTQGINQSNYSITQLKTFAEANKKTNETTRNMTPTKLANIPKSIA